jgi:hypothetical protein
MPLTVVHENGDLCLILKRGNQVADTDFAAHIAAFASAGVEKGGLSVRHSGVRLSWIRLICKSTPKVSNFGATLNTL